MGTWSESQVNLEMGGRSEAVAEAVEAGAHGVMRMVRKAVERADAVKASSTQ
jgi:hypothetical protein